MKVTFIAHSGFLVEWDKFYALFDFWRGELPRLEQTKPLLVFSSHGHEDHFDPRIFSLLDAYPDTAYYLSHDIRLTERRRAKLGVSDAAFARVTSLRADSVFATEAAGEPLTIRTIKSTDVGCAFLLSAEGKLVYHAGDLNWWHWESEGRAYCNNMAANYRRAIETLAKDVRDEAADCGIEPIVDAAMVPLDPRLENAYGLGVEYLMKHVTVKKLFPMHLWEKFDWIERYRAEHPAEADRIVSIAREGERFKV